MTQQQKIYIGQTALRLIGTAGIDLTGASETLLKYRKPNGQEGEWDAIVDLKKYGGIKKDIAKITQKGNEFIGIRLIGNQWMPKGSEYVKGELKNDGFKSFYLNTVEGWSPSSAKIGEKCNKIEIETYVSDIIVEITLTRK